MLKYPEVIQIYLDSVCNLKCRFCLYQNRKDVYAYMDMRTVADLRQFIKRAKTISISACGEPLIFPQHFNDTLKYIYSLNNRSELIAIVTNGTLLSPKVYQLLQGHLADLTISLNAGTPEVYNRDMVLGDWNRTLKVIRSFVKAVSRQGKSKISLHMVAHAENYQDIPAMVEVANDLGINRVRVDQIMVADKKQLNLSLTNVKAEYNQIIQSLKGRVIARTFGTEKKNNPCQSLTNEFHIWADRRVTPCCYNGSFFLDVGYFNTFEDIWFGRDYEKIKKQGIPQCASCPKVLPFDDPRVHIYPLLWEKMKAEECK